MLVLSFSQRVPLVVSAFALASGDGVRGDEAIAEITRLAVEVFSPKSIV